jgi:hypothetical protein
MSDSSYSRFETASPMPPVVVVEDEQPALADTPKRKPTGGPKWETDAREPVAPSAALPLTYYPDTPPAA